MTVEIQPWNAKYIQWLTAAIGRFFDAGVARGGDLLNTQRNIDTYLNLGLRGAAEGDPCLLALVNGRPVAFVLWVGAPAIVDTRWRTINAIGSYTDPAHRSQYIATALRETAIQQAKERGYDRITGPVQLNNPRGVQEFCFTYGAWPTSVNFDLLI